MSLPLLWVGGTHILCRTPHLHATSSSSLGMKGANFALISLSARQNAAALNRQTLYICSSRMTLKPRTMHQAFRGTIAIGSKSCFAVSQSTRPRLTNACIPCCETEKVTSRWVHRPLTLLPGRMRPQCRLRCNPCQLRCKPSIRRGFEVKPSSATADFRSFAMHPMFIAMQRPSANPRQAWLCGTPSLYSYLRKRTALVRFRSWAG